MSGGIEIDREVCLNFHYKRAECRVCHQRCPNQCIDAGQQVKAEQCDQCGICLAVCPVDAVTGLGFSPQAVEKMLTAEIESIVLTCRKRDELSPWPCLGFVDERLLLILAMGANAGDRAVVINNGTCQDCRPAVAHHLSGVVARANHILRQINRQTIGFDTNARIKRLEKSISRRDFFGQLFGAAVTTVREVVVPSVDTPQRIPRHEWFRSYLPAELFSKVADMSTGGSLFYGIRISEYCNACGLCVKICPNHALSVYDRGDVLEIYHNAVQCTACRVCVFHCPKQAMELTHPEKLDKNLVIASPLPRCSECGQLFQPVGEQTVCLECKLKTGPPMIW